MTDNPVDRHRAIKFDLSGPHKSCIIVTHCPTASPYHKVGLREGQQVRNVSTPQDQATKHAGLRTQLRWLRNNKPVTFETV